ncbi:hypothetical protein F9802_13925 [Bacillus aerolatus]|uniref:Uncharacterized protein n=1 Tax=Bacillus aerolatus TaxID=2653354 RepID=A0A6I1FIP2_9BACI|nr:hypothetical protein F9802_13925 [Bacillus aerolatus]
MAFNSSLLPAHLLVAFPFCLLGTPECAPATAQFL